MNEYSGPPPHTCDAPESGGVCSVCGMTWHGITTPDGPWDASPTKDLDDLARTVSAPWGYCFDVTPGRINAARAALAELLQRAKRHGYCACEPKTLEHEAIECIHHAEQREKANRAEEPRKTGAWRCPNGCVMEKLPPIQEFAE